MSNAASSTPDSQVTSLSEFRAGLLSPSWLAMIVALIVSVLGFVFLASFITPDFLRSEGHAYLAFGRDDTQLFSSSKVLRSELVESEVPVVFVLGASGTAEAITEDVHLQEIITRELGREVRSIDLSAYDQTVLETGVYADHLPARFDGVVLIGISPNLLGEGFDEAAARSEPHGSRYGLRSDFVEDFCRDRGRDVPEATGNYFLDHRRFYLSRVPYAFKNLFRGPVELRRHRYRDRELPMIAGKRRRQLARVRARAEVYAEQAPALLEFLEQLARELEKRGEVSVALIETPVAPYAIEEAYGEDFYAAHLERMAAFCAASGLQYWNPAEDAALTNEDFHDYTHLSNAHAQTRFTEALAARVVGYLQSDLR